MAPTKRRRQSVVKISTSKVQKRKVVGRTDD